MGQRKSSYLDVANQAKTTAGGAGKLRGEIGAFRTGYLEPERHKLETIRQGPRPDTEAARGYYRGILEDPGRGKWSPETVRGMFSQTTEAGAGGRNAFLKEMNRQTRAAGMGATGANLRNLQTYDEGFEGRNRGSMRDIQIANELQAREAMKGAAAGSAGIQEMEDRWNLANLAQQQELLGREQQTYNQQGATFGTELDSLNPQMQAYEGAYRPGFWGKLGSSFATGLGSGLAGLATGGVTGAGYNLGQRAMGGLMNRGGNAAARPTLTPGVYGSTADWSTPAKPWGYG